MGTHIHMVDMHFPPFGVLTNDGPARMMNLCSSAVVSSLAQVTNGLDTPIMLESAMISILMHVSRD